MATVLVIAVVAVAYGTQAPQLGVAEFAPAARNQVEAPPTTAGSEERPGPGARGGRQTTTTTSAPASGAQETAASASSPTTKVGRARECFGNPPRQTFDPRTPACMATMFEGDNGGATARGVGPAEVRVAVTGPPSTDDQRRINALFEHFNRTFELYGRRLVPVYVPVSAGLGAVPEQRAAAATIGAAEVFASLGNQSAQWLPSFYAELARQGVVSVLYNSSGFGSDRDLFDELHPYVWSVLPSVEQVSRNLASFVCSALAGRPAAHGGPSVVQQTRKFAVIVSGVVRLPSTRTLVDGLSQCGVDPMVASLASEGATAEWQGRTKVALESFKAGGATTLICLCADNLSPNIAGLVDDVGFEDAEWLLPTFAYDAFEEFYLQNRWPAALRSHVFGLQPMLRVSAVQGTAWLDAARSVDPAVTPDQGYMLSFYERLLVLAAGVQGAGPNLTPETFAAGLMATNFPNSDAGRAPLWLPSVGFGPGDHSFFNDYALAWWSNTATPFGQFPSSVGGSWCYLGAGARYQVGTFPADADSRFFSASEPCR